MDVNGFLSVFNWNFMKMFTAHSTLYVLSHFYSELPMDPFVPFQSNSDTAFLLSLPKTVIDLFH